MGTAMLTSHDRPCHAIFRLLLLLLQIKNNNNVLYSALAIAEWEMESINK